MTTGKVWYVIVVHTATGRVVKCLGPHAERYAERLRGGVERNLDVESYHTSIVDTAHDVDAEIGT